MKCKNKHVVVDGGISNGKTMITASLTCIITNDEHGKTLSINNGDIQFSIPFEPIEKYLK